MIERTAENGSAAVLVASRFRLRSSLESHSACFTWTSLRVFFSSIPVRGRTRVARFQVAFETLLWMLVAWRVLLGRRRYRSTPWKNVDVIFRRIAYKLEKLITIQFIVDRSVFITLCREQIFGEFAWFKNNIDPINLSYENFNLKKFFKVFPNNLYINTMYQFKSISNLVLK